VIERPFRVVAFAALFGALFAGLRAGLVTTRPAGDFLRYQRAATLVWRGEANLLYDAVAVRAHRAWGDPARYPEMRYRYSPALATAMAPLGALPPARAWVVWSALCGAMTAGGAAAAAVLGLRRLPPSGRRWIPVAAATIPLLALYSENVKLGQMNCFAFGLSVAALLAVDRGRDRAAGLCVAGAAIAKHLPVFLVLWFLWQGRRRAAGWAAAALVVFGFIVPSLALGPVRHHRLLAQWTGQESHLVAGGDDDEDEEDEGAPADAPARPPRAEGQSLKALLFRGLTPTPFFHLKGSIDRKADREAEDDAPREAQSPGARGIVVNVASLDPDLVHGLWVVASLAVLAALLRATGPGRGPGDPAAAARRFPLEAGAVLASLLLVSPESRNPHFQMLAPAFAALAAGHLAARASGRAADRIGLALVATGAVLVLVPTKGLVGRAVADHLLARGSIGIGAALVYLACLRALLAERRADASEAARRAAATTER
jgi:hypothetical protein